MERHVAHIAIAKDALGIKPSRLLKHFLTAVDRFHIQMQARIPPTQEPRHPPGPTAYVEHLCTGLEVAVQPGQSQDAPQCCLPERYDQVETILWGARLEGYSHGTRLGLTLSPGAHDRDMARLLC
eukprot:3588272-Pyramimonas_sp.AAC.1